MILSALEPAAVNAQRFFSEPSRGVYISDTVMINRMKIFAPSESFTYSNAPVNAADTMPNFSTRYDYAASTDENLF